MQTELENATGGKPAAASREPKKKEICSTQPKQQGPLETELSAAECLRTNPGAGSAGFPPGHRGDRSQGTGGSPFQKANEIVPFLLRRPEQSSSF